MSESNWFGRLKAGLSKSSTRLVDGIAGVFTRRKLDAEAVGELEDVLITADLGPAAAARLASALASGASNRTSMRTRYAACSPTISPIFWHQRPKA